MKKILLILVILLGLAAFSFFEISRKSKVTVLDVINAKEILVDINGNNVADNNETICVPDIETFTIDLTKDNTPLAKKLGITKENALRMGYLTDTYAENLLADAKVSIKYTGESNQNCQYADLIINNESYKDKLVHFGYALKNGEINDLFKNKLSQAEKLNLVILNHKSNKYHKLDCEYGLVAHDVVIIPESQLVDGEKPCQFCHVKPKAKTAKTTEQQKPQGHTFPLAISNGKIKIYLTDLTTTLKPNKECVSMVCKELVKNIDEAKTSIDIAIYGWDTVPAVYDAFVRAKARGVKIRIAYDVSSNQYYPETNSLLDIADAKSGDDVTKLMHNKFMIFDNKIITTGSMNYAKTGLSGFNSNCILFIESEELAQIYEEEFSQMLQGNFHQNKQQVNHKTIQIGDAYVTPMFSPKDSVLNDHVIDYINNAKSYIYIPAFIITHDGLAKALIRAKNRNVDVKIIIDATNAKTLKSKIPELRKAGIPIKVENYAGKIHSKSIIIDDKYIIVGSMNFTFHGNDLNDENTLIIESPRFAKYYKDFFEYIWAKIPKQYLYKYVRAEGIESIGSCEDGVDNDYDGNFDNEDEGCTIKDGK